MRFWDLPGPRMFLERVEGELRDGKNVLVATPTPVPLGFLNVLCDQLEQSGWQFASLQAIPSHLPVDCLYEALHIAAPPREVRNATKFSEKLESNLVILIDDITHEEWPRWKTFLAEYEAICRLKSPYERTLLVCIAHGVEEEKLPIGGLALAVAKWQGVLCELDMLSYASARVQEKGIDGARAQLIATTIARLARWDVTTANVLLDAGDKELFAPQALLYDLALSKGWEIEQGATWQNGAVDLFDGRQQVHSAFLALNDPGKEIEMRIWSSQASSLLPLVELHRRDIVPKIRHRLKLPTEVNGETVQDAFDLEIGVLAHLAVINNVDPEVRAKLRKLKHIRNALAHLSVLDATTALDPELLII